jgi:predicted small lipoprotein YifL
MVLADVNGADPDRMPSRPTLAAALGLLLLGTLAVSGCGVHGSLEAPPQAKAATTTGDAVPGTPGQPTPHKPSVLDPLIR